MRTVVVSSLFAAVALVGCTNPSPEATAPTATLAAAAAPAAAPEGGCHDDVRAADASAGPAGSTEEEGCATKAGGHAEHAAVAEAHEAKSKGDREQIDADGVVRRGSKLTDGAALTVVDAVARAAEFDGKPVKITGKVESVCQAMGCWFTLQAPEGGQTIRISSKGHDIFVPKAAAGRLATVEGDFKVKTISKAQAQHFEDERALKPGETRKTFTEDVKELSIAIVALEMRPSA